MESNDPKAYPAEWHGDYEDGKLKSPARLWKGVEDERNVVAPAYWHPDKQAYLTTPYVTTQEQFAAHDARIRRETARECAELAVAAIYDHHSVRSRDDLRAAIIDPIDHPKGWNDHDAIVEGGEG